MIFRKLSLYWYMKMFVGYAIDDQSRLVMFKHELIFPEGYIKTASL